MLGCDGGDRAAMAANRLRRRRALQHRLAFRRIRIAAPQERRSESMIVLGAVHVLEAPPVEHRNVARFGLAPREQGREPARAVEGEDFREQRAPDHRRMAALAAKRGIEDGRARPPKRRRGAA